MKRTMIYFNNSQDNYKISYALKMLIRRAVCASLEFEGYGNDAEVSITLTDNEGIRALNREFRGLDKPTDVLSFPLVEYEASDTPTYDDDANMLGDIVISLERAEEQANEFGHSFDREVAFLTAHSMLHLLGYDHEKSDEDDADMRCRQNEIMKILGLEVK